MADDRDDDANDSRKITSHQPPLNLWRESLKARLGLFAHRALQHDQICEDDAGGDCDHKIIKLERHQGFHIYNVHWETGSGVHHFQGLQTTDHLRS